MAIADEHRRILDVNPALSRLLGYRPSEIRGRNLWDFNAGVVLTRAEWHGLISQPESTGEVQILCADGSTVHAQFAVYPEVVTGQRLVLFVALNVSRWGRHFRRDVPQSPAHHDSLSLREREVLHLVALGATSPEIATQLHISHNTVRKHVNSAMRKLGARSRAHLVAKAFGDGMIEP
jgi:PAS domain S-box-containing protein